MLVFFIMVMAGAASANSYDIPQNGNAELNGMAGAGIAHVKGGGSIACNPAGVAGIDKYEIEFTGNGMLMTYKAPANGPYSQCRTDNYAPLGFLGAAYRFTKTVCGGILFFTPSGGGASFGSVNLGIPYLPPRRFNGQLVFFEFGPVIAFNLPGNIRIGIGYRINYFEQWGRTYSDFAPFSIAPVIDYWINPIYITFNDAHFNGFCFYGFRIGIQYDPLEWLHIGVSYRTPIQTNASGTTKITSAKFPVPVRVGTVSYQQYADMAALGFTFDIVKNIVLLSIDGSVTFYDRYETDKHSIGPIDVDSPVHNNTGYSGSIGVEWMALPSLPVRAGFNASSNIFKMKYINPQLGGIPAPSYVIALGTGYYFSKGMRVNIAGSYLINYRRVKHFSGFNTPGYYSANGPFVSLELKYVAI